jgi:hypothetical protein
MSLRAALLAVIVVPVLTCSGAFAAVVDQPLQFSPPNNGLKTYTTSDGLFVFSPTNFQSSSHCVSSSCLIETKQGVVTTLARADASPFTLSSFYFSLTGKGGPKAEQSITAHNDATGKSLTLSLGKRYDFVTDASGSFVTGPLQHNTGYYVSLLGLDTFKDATSVTWTAANAAQVRLDGVSVRNPALVTPMPGDLNTPQPGDLVTPRPGDLVTPMPGDIVTPIPVPGAGLMLLGGIGALIWRGQRKAA